MRRIFVSEKKIDFLFLPRLKIRKQTRQFVLLRSFTDPYYLLFRSIPKCTPQLPLCPPYLFYNAGCKMCFLACESEARKVDLGVKNKWRHDWLQTEDSRKRKYAMWAQKVDEPGMAWWFLCCRQKDQIVIYFFTRGISVGDFAPHTPPSLATFQLSVLTFSGAPTHASACVWVTRQSGQSPCIYKLWSQKEWIVHRI